ncbi:MAG: thiamine-binding protein [Flavobacteriales bacterium]|nr:thiamine-binding protein [Flavobacteriales bacterium]
MKAIAEISLYPLKDSFIPPIDAFIEALNKYDSLEVSTNALSTMIKGEYDVLMEKLTKEIKLHFEGGIPSVFVLKIHAIAE